MKFSTNSKKLFVGGLNAIVPQFFYNHIRKPHLLLACMPKSGSTYLKQIIANLPNMQNRSLVPDFGRREQELDLLMCYYNQNRRYIAQHHVRYSETLKEQMQIFKISPVILVRNIYDIVVSLRDHFKRESTVSPMTYVPQDIIQCDDDTFDFIVTMLIPWYFNFYLSWKDCDNKIIITYDQLVSDPVSTVMLVNDFYNLSFKRSEVINALSLAKSKNIRKNVAVCGRGDELSVALKDKIKKMARFYAGVDFSPMGII